MVDQSFPVPDLLLAEPVAQKRLRVVALDGVDMRNEMLAVRNRNQRQIGRAHV